MLSILRALRQMFVEMFGVTQEAVLRLFVDATEQGMIPDFILRAGIRVLLKRRVAEVLQLHRSGFSQPWQPASKRVLQPSWQASPLGPGQPSTAQAAAMLSILRALRQMFVEMFGVTQEAVLRLFVDATEQGMIPDFILRAGIRVLLKRRVAEVPLDLKTRLQQTVSFAEELKAMPIAINTDEANSQHYEVPTPYYLLCLGSHLKYSSCLYQSSRDTLDQAEFNMLNLYCERAQLQPGQRVLELGCGWGSFSLFAAARYPASTFTAVSNSATQKAFIDEEARKRGITNLTVLTANVVELEAPGELYDRVVSIEMFEHMKNYQKLLHKVASWLLPEGKLFVHIFVHRSTPYHFEVKSEADWMSKYFFTGGTMPSLDLLLYFQDDMVLRNHWYVDGCHYSRTLEAWLLRHDRHGREVTTILEGAYKGSKDSATVWFYRWRMFYIACSELFKYRGGEEWGVGHYLFERR
ncbi:(S)-coclaurine N-methyltransferase [Tetrabaena socialis]|uniref:(S)-coclaurine N-methyltransferase n=1 Tax=Tetrabaena socialis TaxID=47790 RepID=A0A2J8AFE0_9CHLO|nr:(S)-coclaurine N-methyltransferase [Tetrabaena socialis]|eukprot:PNH11237.1 (S)-coclaurine N-methyltransferase [Tetrabaena socialis]